MPISAFRQKLKNYKVDLLFQVALGLYVLLAVVLFWRQPVITALMLALGLGFHLWVRKEKADIVMAVVAGLIGAPAEAVSVKLGVWSYKAPGLVMGVPFWLPLVWAYLFTLFRRLAITMHFISWKFQPKANFKARALLFSIIIGMTIGYVILTVLLVRPDIAVILALVTTVTAIFCHKEWDFLIFWVSAILGTIGEFICMQLGFWHYHYPFFSSIGLPLSLPLAWGLSGVIFGRISKTWEKKI